MLSIKKNIKTTKESKKTGNVLLIATPTNKLVEFFQLGPLEQGISSLLGLVLMYGLATGLYNKRLRKSNLEMSFMFRFGMIISDLLINLALGLYYLDYRETLMGFLMIKCPIAVSPVIFVLELAIVIVLKEYEIYLQRNKSNK